ncbi:signal peptide peptidase SppA [Adhaeretor mobilis]|uniref:Protease 4 n=1 Tax=Adhaeretor mobilis TaxID=1930276 RepID=A0A517MSM8_9BACT|nr:signal peptide peptidase SppA [Adhaeretor mobilis]QDS97890.1 Protease 4 [Adhaeretor mobilis]
MPKSLTALLASLTVSLCLAPVCSSAKEGNSAVADKADAAKSADEKPEKQPTKIRLAHIAIKGELPESPGQMSLFGDLGVDLRKTIARIDKAAEDAKIDGIILEIHNGVGRGKLNELRSAIKRAKVSGKKVYAHLETAISTQYQLAAACDEIVMPSSGMVFVPGVRGDFTFYKDMLAKLGVEADMIYVGEYKGAAESLMRDSLSEPVRENLSAMIDDLFDQLVAGIAADRQMTVEAAREAIDRGLLTAEDAKEAGLVDRLEYADEFRDRLKGQYKADKLVYVMNYAKKKVDTDFSGPMGMMKLFQAMLGGDSKRTASGPKIAIVYAVGPIMSGKSENSPFGGQSMGSDTIVKALNEAAADENVKAIVLRVNSPGGSALASDLMWRATQATDKPIIASMGDVAASGGYYISMGCDRIFAEPGTVTGSIGVVGGKIAMGGLYEKIGMDTESISRGKNSGIFSATEKFTESERAAIESMMQRTYEQFTTKAAEGRGMEIEALEELAKGQVYTGRDAKRIGLVDELGTLKDAVQAARTMAGLGADDDVQMKILPEPENPFDALFGMDSDAQKEVSLEMRLLAELFGNTRGLKSHLRQVLQLQRVFQEPVATMMPFTLEIQ